MLNRLRVVRNKCLDHAVERAFVVASISLPYRDWEFSTCYRGMRRISREIRVAGRVSVPPGPSGPQGSACFAKPSSNLTGWTLNSGFPGHG